MESLPVFHNKSRVWTPEPDDYGNPATSRLFCTSPVLVCKLVTSLTFLILSWAVMIKGLRAQATTRFDATSEATCTCFPLHT